MVQWTSAFSLSSLVSDTIKYKYTLLHLSPVIEYYLVLYPTQVNSAFCAYWLASLEMISQVLNHLRAAELKQNGFPFQKKLLLNKYTYSLVH